MFPSPDIEIIEKVNIRVKIKNSNIIILLGERSKN